MLKISELGLVQMTRKRTRDSLQAMLTDQCPRCNGRAVIKSAPTLAAEILRGIQRDASRRNHGGMLMVKINPEIARYLYDPGFKALEELEQRCDARWCCGQRKGSSPAPSSSVRPPPPRRRENRNEKIETEYKHWILPPSLFSDTSQPSTQQTGHRLCGGHL